MARRTGRRGDARQRVDYRALAELRYQLRRFLRIRELAARGAGVEPQQYLLLLQLKGLGGRSATIGRLAERLQVRHHSVVELVDRLVERRMLARQRSRTDRREVLVALRPAGEAVLRCLARHSLAELRMGGPALLRALKRLIAESGRRGPPSGPTQRNGRVS